MKDKIIETISNAIEKYFELEREENKFVPGKTRIQFAGPVFDEKEIKASLSSLLTGWFTLGNLTRNFEESFAKFLNAKSCFTVNSGSSALMLAWNTLKNKALDNPIKDGDEIITCALTHTATANSVLLNNLRLVLVDADIDTYNIDTNLIEDAITDKTKGILPMHFLGNPCEMDKIMKIAKKNNLYVVEDVCDGYGSEYDNKKIGTFGDLAAASFYTAHVITLGEGGAVICNNETYSPIIQSLRSWGRACPCPVCKINIDQNYNCPIRFKTGVKGFEDYDLRYMFSDIGYNLKILEVQAAFGLEQLKKINEFIKKREENFNYITKALKKYDSLILPKTLPKSKPVWFTIPITIKEDASFKRKELVDWLEKHKIETRPFFAGYLPEQPAYKNVDLKIIGDLKVTRFTRDNSFFIGCYPGITEEMREYIVSVFDEFFCNR